jgi:hypothetical protein
VAGLTVSGLASPVLPPTAGSSALCGGNAVGVIDVFDGAMSAAAAERSEGLVTEGRCPRDRCQFPLQ